jgi:hypothetical protein
MGQASNPASNGDRGVLVVASGSDDLARRVVEQLRARPTPVVWVDPGRAGLPEVSVHLGGDTAVGTVRAADPGAAGELRELSLDRVWHGWYHPPAIPGHLAAGQRLAAGWTLLEPLWLLMPRWLQTPSDLALAASRPAQLQRAHAVGLHIPATLVTTSTADARGFQQHTSDLIATPLTWPLASPPAGAVGDQASLERITHPRLLQADTRGVARIRVTVVDDWVNAVRVRLSPQDHQPAPIEVNVPHRVHTSIHDPMAALALQFAVLDFTELQDGSWIFLGLDATPHEVTEQALAGVDVAAQLADALADGDTTP